MIDKQFISNELRAGWQKQGYSYYHTEGGYEKSPEVFFINHDLKSTVTFKKGKSGRMILDSKNFNVDDVIMELIEQTKLELGLK
jgi:hypothetical protein